MVSFNLNIGLIMFFSNPKLSVLEEVIVTDGPYPLEAYFTKNVGTVEIKFDKNLQGSKGCSKIFDSSTYAKLGEGKYKQTKFDLFIIYFRSNM